jgi:hypothetical protein
MIEFVSKMLSTRGKEGTKHITKNKYSTLFKRGKKKKRKKEMVHL